jgi:hypothetical protein
MNPLQQQSPFAPTSRYYGLARLTYVDGTGTEHSYVARRFIPSPDQYATIGMHSVVEGERYDTLAAEFLGDPEQFWRLADANLALDPSDLETPCRTVRVTLPAGVPGYPND